MLENWNVFVWNRFDWKVWDWFKLAIVEYELYTIKDNNEKKEIKEYLYFDWAKKKNKRFLAQFQDN